MSSLWQIECEFLDAIRDMERAGVLVDKQLSQEQLVIGSGIMQEVSESLGGLNPGSPKDLKTLLIDEMNLPIVKYNKPTSTGIRNPSFDKEAMKEYELILNQRDDPTAKRILEYRGWQKACSTYYRAFLKHSCGDGRVRPNFKLHGTVTGRLSCEEPNFQQIPKTTDDTKPWNKYTKSALIAPEGWSLWEFDYSNLELRLAAAYSQDKNLLEAFNSDVSVWDFMMDKLGWDKNTTKTFTYCTLYGGGVKRIQNIFGVSSDMAKELRSDFFKTFPGLRSTYNRDSSSIADRVARKAASDGYVQLWTGRRRHFEYPEDQAHKAFNSVLQGGGAEIVKRALLRVWKKVCDDNCILVLTVHDSICLQIREGVEDLYLSKIKEEMERMDFAFGVPFPVDCHVWGE